MLLKVVKLNGVNHIITCVESGPIDDEDRELTFYCQRVDGMLSFVEVLPFVDFRQRLKDLNARVKFPDSAVRKALMSNDPAQASLAEPNPAGVGVLSLKYSMAETPAPLKWEWHLKVGSPGTFYRQVFLSAAKTGDELLDLVGTLREKLLAKDKELEQYRREGFQLRRTTVKTRPFDMKEFNELNEEVLTEAASYMKINELFENGPGPSSLIRDRPLTPSTPSASSNGSGSPASARSRKRAAQAVNSKHLEMKIKQRRNQPQVAFKNSQSSQEEDITDWLTENVPTNGVKQENETPQFSGATAPHALVTPKAEATIKTEKDSEEPVVAAQEALDDSDQELNELREILGCNLGQKPPKQEE